jgi:hypothetical protein
MPQLLPGAALTPTTSTRHSSFCQDRELQFVLHIGFSGGAQCSNFSHVCSSQVALVKAGIILKHVQTKHLFIVMAHHPLYCTVLWPRPLLQLFEAGSVRQFLVGLAR